VLDVEADLKMIADGLDRGSHFRENLMLAASNNRSHAMISGSREEAPEFDEVAVDWERLFAQRALHELIELRIAFRARSKSTPADLAARLMMLAETGHARGGDTLCVTRPQGIQQGTVAFVEEEDAINLVLKCRGSRPGAVQKARTSG